MFAAAATATASLPVVILVALLLEKELHFDLPRVCRCLRTSLFLLPVACRHSIPQPFLLSSLDRALPPLLLLARPACPSDPGWTIRRHW